jgi:hypothetical protein
VAPAKPRLDGLDLAGRVTLYLAKPPRHRRTAPLEQTGPGKRLPSDQEQSSPDPAPTSNRHKCRHCHERGETVEVSHGLTRTPTMVEGGAQAVRINQAVSIGGLVERWYDVIEGWSNPRAWTILDARGRSPMCDRVASPLLGRGAGGRSPGYPSASVAPPKSPPNRYRESESGISRTLPGRPGGVRSSGRSGYRNCAYLSLKMDPQRTSAQTNLTTFSKLVRDHDAFQ